MNSLLSTLAIQSWCFRGVKDHPSVIKSLLACGVRHVELCGYHLDPALPADYSADLALYQIAGIGVTAYGVERFSAEEAKARKIFQFAQRCNFPMIAADLDPGGLAVVEKLCREFNKKIGIHNHGRRHRLGSPWALEDLFAQSSPNIGLCLDTAWMLDQDYDPLEIAKKFQSRLFGLHIKDFLFTRAGKPEDVVVGTGNLNLDALTRWLVEINWAGSLTLEYEGDVPNPVPALAQCVQALHASFDRASAS